MNAPLNTELEVISTDLRDRPTTEHWSPYRPALQTHKGQQYYLSGAVFRFLDGRGVCKMLYAGTPEETSDQVLMKTIALMKELPPVRMEEYQDILARTNSTRRKVLGLL